MVAIMINIIYNINIYKQFASIYQHIVVCFLGFLIANMNYHVNE